MCRVTFVGIATKGDHAEIVVDEGSYASHEVKIRRSTKVIHLHHLDAVFTVSGNPYFVRPAEEALPTAGLQHGTFDKLIEGAPGWLANAAEVFAGSPNADVSSGSVYLVGYSDKLAEFAAYRFTPRALEGTRVQGALVQPVPFSLRPPLDDLKYLIKGLARAGFPDDFRADLWNGWSKAPQARVPETAADWIDLAQLARDERALQGEFLRVLVTRRLWLTTLRRGESSTQAIHEFDDTNPETLARMLMGSLHPIGQWLPCDCGETGKPTVECCFADALDEPCGCGSQKLFRDCCLIERSEVRPDLLWTSPFAW